MRALLFIVLLAGSSACLRKTEYHCSNDAQCTGNPGGVCEPSTYCSFTDTTCDSGRRYGEFGGELANQCVGDNIPGGDGGVDSRLIDAPPGACPAGYVSISGGGTHLYKKTVNAAAWMTQRDRCAADGSNVHLAIPDTVNELTAITTVGAAALTWVGIEDLVTEGTYVTVSGAAAPIPPLVWASGEPDNAGGMGGQDCVSAQMASPVIQTDACGDSNPAVCECEP